MPTKNIAYCKSSDTIRQMPENYILATRKYRGGWVMEPDLAADITFVLELTKVLMKHENKYGNPEKVIAAVKEKVRRKSLHRNCAVCGKVRSNQTREGQAGV